MLAMRYVAWLGRHARAVLIAAGLATAGAAYLAAFHLPLESDFSHLLPDDAPAVRDAERLAARLPIADTMLMLIVAPDEPTREAVARRAAARLRALDPELIARIEDDDAELRSFIAQHRHLFTPLADLEAARAALADQIRDARLRANPMFVDLSDDDDAPAAFAELHAKQQAAEARLARSAHVSADGLTHVIVIRTAFRGTDVERDLKLMRELDALSVELSSEHPLVGIGYAGGPVVTVAEHRALTRGMVLSSLVTIILVAFVLIVHLRSVRLLVLLTANLAVGTIVAFGLAAITVGQLNAATAFLGAIIAGNGVNYGILLVARFLDERRRRAPEAALAAAIAGTLRPTLVASLGAAVAYGSLAATQFRGFADFAVIGGAGMLACWLASFTLLPVLVLVFAPSPRRSVSPVFGGVVARVFGFRRPVIACAVAGAVTLAAGAITWRFLADDPYEYDLTALRSRAPDAARARQWLKLSDETFGQGLAGIAGQTFIAVDRADQVPQVVDALDRLRASTSAAGRPSIIGPMRSLLDVVPEGQDAKLAVLAELRQQLDELAPLLDDRERAELLAWRPPDELAAIDAAALPAGLAERLTERDGRIGLVIAVRPGEAFDERDGRDLIAFAEAVRRIELASGEAVSTAGPAVLFADVLLQIQRDGPIITAIAVLGLVAVVLLVVGPSRRSLAVLLATGAGSIVMVAVCALAGLKINFLDFVALPITLGLGIDYAINLAEHRTTDADTALRTTGGSVLVCSLTTVIGYGSLLVSDNLSIRGFGLASLIGEVTCVIAALVLVPAIVNATLPATASARLRVEELTSL
jgi:uncharacterized protein